MRILLYLIYTHNDLPWKKMKKIPKAYNFPLESEHQFQFTRSRHNGQVLLPANQTVMQSVWNLWLHFGKTDHLHDLSSLEYDKHIEHSSPLILLTVPSPALSSNWLIPLSMSIIKFLKACSCTSELLSVVGCRARLSTAECWWNSVADVSDSDGEKVNQRRTIPIRTITITILIAIRLHSKQNIIWNWREM